MTAKGPYCRAMFFELLPKAPIGNTPHVSDLRNLSCSKIVWSFSPEYKEKIICSRAYRWGVFKICYYSWSELWIFTGSEIYSETSGFGKEERNASPNYWDQEILSQWSSRHIKVKKDLFIKSWLYCFFSYGHSHWSCVMINFIIRGRHICWAIKETLTSTCEWVIQNQSAEKYLLWLSTWKHSSFDLTSFDCSVAHKNMGQAFKWHLFKMTYQWNTAKWISGEDNLIRL